MHRLEAPNCVMVHWYSNVVENYQKIMLYNAITPHNTLLEEEKKCNLEPFLSRI